MRYEGAIYRPPGEWKSYLLQATVGCSHNSCTFCSMYKEKHFRIRSLNALFDDIEMAKNRYGDLTRIFLCDGDAVAMKTEDMLVLLAKLYETFPSLERVNAYVGPRTALQKTEEELTAMHKAGLSRLYLGVETGWNILLTRICKGVTAKQMLQAGQRLVAAGFDLWVMIILGLAGPGENSRTHMLETAALINTMAPRHLSALTFMPAPGTPMGDEVARGVFQLLSPAEVLEETKLLLEQLKVAPLHFTSDHASNYLPLKGGLPEKREELLAMVDLALRGQMGIKPEHHRGL